MPVIITDHMLKNKVISRLEKRIQSNQTDTSDVLDGVHEECLKYTK